MWEFDVLIGFTHSYRSKIREVRCHSFTHHEIMGGSTLLMRQAHGVTSACILRLITITYTCLSPYSSDITSKCCCSFIGCRCDIRKSLPLFDPIFLRIYCLGIAIVDSNITRCNDVVECVFVVFLVALVILVVDIFFTAIIVVDNIIPVVIVVINVRWRFRLSGGWKQWQS